MGSLWKISKETLFFLFFSPSVVNQKTGLVTSRVSAADHSDHTEGCLLLAALLHLNFFGQSIMAER